jgi:hypothetical protein
MKIDRITDKDGKIAKQAWRVKEFLYAFGIAKSFFYEQIALGRLKTIKAGKATLITRQAAEEWLTLCESEMPSLILNKKTVD